MNHIKTMLCENFIGMDKLERLELLQSDPLINEFTISIKEPETVSRFLGNFNYKATYMLQEINFKILSKVEKKSFLTSHFLKWVANNDASGGNNAKIK